MKAMNSLFVGGTLMILAGALSPSAHAEAETVSTKTMSFEKCLETIRRTSAQLGIAPINIVESNELRIVRYRTTDGSILVTCSRADRKMIITKSDNRG